MAKKISNQRSTVKADVDLGKKIRTIRIAKNMSQAALGECLGVSFQQVQKYEKGVNRVGAARLQQIAKGLDEPVSAFIDVGDASDSSEAVLNLATSMTNKEVQRVIRSFITLPPDMRGYFSRLVENMADHVSG